jgi:hypothetical protein
MRRFIAAICCLYFMNSNVKSQDIKSPAISGRDWKDVDGQFVNAHGAGLLYFEETYYLFGEIKKGTTTLVPNQNWEDYRVSAGGVSCYSSRDLLHWKYEGVALAPVTGDPGNDLDTSRVIERPKVLFNEKSGKFVMWLHIDKQDYSYARAGMAISDKPEGPYHYLGSIWPNGQMARDMTLFKDDDGKAYLIYASEDNNTMQVCLLSDDFLTPTEKFIRIFINQRREAPAMFTYQGKYFLITSLCSGWDPNPAMYAVADSVMGEWEVKGNPCVGPGAERTFDAQSSFVLALPGEPGSFIFMADRWDKANLSGSDYLWLSFRIKDSVVEIKNDKPAGESLQQ